MDTSHGRIRRARATVSVDASIVFAMEKQAPHQQISEAKHGKSPLEQIDETSRLLWYVR